MNHMVELLPFLLLIGACGGFMSGLLGVGGGIIFVPALYFTLSASGVNPDQTMHIAVASSMAIIVVSVSSSALTHYKNGNTDKKLFLGWMPFIIAGAITGVVLASIVNGDFLKNLFAVFTLGIAAYMGFSDTKDETVKKIRGLTENIQKALSFLIGVSCTMIGLGGGALTVPLMRASGVSMKKAIGTGAALGPCVAIPAVIGHILIGLKHADSLPPYSIGYVNFLVVALILPAAIPMAYAGAKVSTRMNKTFLQRAFALVMLAVSLKMLWPA
jgi:uncharacterized membrane protein YfcA